MSQNQEWKQVQNGKNGTAEKPSKDSSQYNSNSNSPQQGKPQRQRQPRENGEGGGGDRGGGRGGHRGGGRQGGGYPQNYNQSQGMNGYRQPKPKQAPSPEYAIKPAIDADSISQVMKEGEPENMQATLLELVNQRADIDQRLVTLSDQVVQKGSQYLSMEAKLKSSINILNDTKAEREQTVTDLNSQLSEKSSEVFDLLEKLQSSQGRLDSVMQEKQHRERELAGARSQLEEAVRKLAVCEEGISNKKSEVSKIQIQLEDEKARAEDMDRRGRVAEEQVQQMKVSLGHKDFQNYQLVDKIRGMELHFQNQYARWNQDRQSLEQELYKLKGVTTELMPFSNADGTISTDMGTNIQNNNNNNSHNNNNNNINFGALPKTLTEEELLSVFAVIIGEGRQNAKPWTSQEEAILDNTLLPFKWAESYAQKYGTMVDFIRSHNALFKEREEDGWLYRVEGAMPRPQLGGILPPGVLPPLPPHGFPVSNGANMSPLGMMPMLGKLGGADFSNGMVDEMKGGLGNPMQFLGPNQKMPFPPMLVTPLAPQKPPQSVAQTQVEGQENGLVNQVQR